jgi:tetratricopeptide (TPR) repeat protein
METAVSRLVASWFVRVVQIFAALAVLHLSSCGSPEDRAQDHYQRGIGFTAKNDTKRARIEFRNAIQAKNDFLPALRALARIEEGERNWQALVAILRRVAAVDQSDIDVRLRLARIALLGGGLREALEWANAATAIANANPSALALRAAILLKLGNESEALQEAERARAIDPSNTEAVIVLAAARFARDDADGTLTILNSVPVAQNEDLGIELFRNIVDEKLGKVQQIQERLERLIARHPQEAAIKVQLLQFYLAHGRRDEAEQLLRNIAAANPADPKAGLDVVRFLNEVKGPAAARQELLARMQAGGDIFPYQMALVDLELAESNIAAGVQRLEAMIRDLKVADMIVAARIRLAQLHVSAKDFGAAEPIVDHILREDARNATALGLRASIRLEHGRAEDAIIDLRQALNEQPRWPGLMSLLAIAYERSGSIDLADKQFADATRTSDFAPAAGLDYVAFLQRRGRSAQAEEVLIRLSNRHPTNVAVLANLAQIRLARQDWDGARELAVSIRRLGDQRGLADQILATALNGQKKHAEGLAVLEEAYAANPGSFQQTFALIRAYVQAQQIDKAEAVLDSLLSKNSANAEALALKGWVQMARNAPHEAAKSFKAAIDAQPDNPAAYRALAEVHISRKEYDEALQWVRAGLRELPGSAPLRLAEANILELKGDIDAAIEQYEILLKEQPGSLVIANNLASLLSEHRADKASLQRAHTIAKRLAKSHIPQFKDTLGWIGHLSGDQTATSLLEEAAAELPNDPLVRYHLAMSYLAAGEDAKAKAELSKASDLLSPDQGGPLADKIRAALKE